MSARAVLLPVQTFASLCDLARQRVAGRGVPSDSGNSSMTPHDGASWDAGVSTLPDAIRLAETGWDAGNAAVADAMDVYDADDAPDGGWDLAPAGAFVCVPAYVSGEPECMFQKQPGEAQRRVRLIMSGSYLYDVTAESGLVYAEACAAYAAALMAKGLDVAITAVQVNQAPVDNALSVMPLTVKEYGQEPDGSRIAVAAHPGFFRRVGFAWREMSPAMPAASRAGGYGSTAYNPRNLDLVRRALGPDAADERLIALPGLTSAMAKLRTADAMLAYFQKHAIDTAAEAAKVEQ